MRILRICSARSPKCGDCVLNDICPKNIEYKDSVMYIERTLNNGKVRKGIVAAIDLENYKFVGWYTEPNGQGKHIMGGCFAPEYDHTLYAYIKTVE